MSALKGGANDSCMKYRPDIDGLRALAILPVIFYHAGLPAFSGGYVGVDIFFVISGFLISGIIIDAIARGDFSYAYFYERRARRLLPGLFTVIAVSIPAGYLLLMPENYEEFFESSMHAVLFVSNLFFLHNVNYFGQEADFMPLLHTWSLAVEEQFYMAWPLVLVVYIFILRKAGTYVATMFITGIVILSLAAAVTFLERYPAMVFYLTPFRLWELGLGTLAAILLRSQHNIDRMPSRSLYTLGLFLCIVSIFLLDQESAFPGLNAVPVCVGAVLLVLFGGSERNSVSAVFRSQPLVLVGKMSYSLYLWHWTVLAFYRVYKNNVSLSFFDVMFCLILTFVCSFFAWRFVENPIRFRSSRVQIARFSFGVGTLLLAVSSAGIASGGAAYRADPDVAYVSSRSEMWRWPCERRHIEGLRGRLCVFGADWEAANRHFVLWGDSHADHLAPLVGYAAEQEGVAVLLWRGCPAFIDNKNVRRWHQRSTEASQRCGRLRHRILDWLSGPHANVDGVILAAAWSGYPNSLFAYDPDERSPEEGIRLIRVGLETLIDRLDADLLVTILTDVPRPGKVLLACAHTALPVLRAPGALACGPLDRSQVEGLHNPTSMTLKEVAADHANVQVIDMVERMCDADGCPIFIEGRLLYSDGNHVRRNLSVREKSTLVEMMNLSGAFVPDISTRTSSR